MVNLYLAEKMMQFQQVAMNRRNREAWKFQLMRNKPERMPMQPLKPSVSVCCVA